MKRLIAVILAVTLLSTSALAGRVGYYTKVTGGRTAVELPLYDDNFVYADYSMFGNDGNEFVHPVAVSQAMAYANQKLADIKSKYGITVKTDWAVTDGESAWLVIREAKNVEQMFDAIPAAPYIGKFCAKVGKPIVYSAIDTRNDPNPAGITAYTGDNGNSISITMCVSVPQLAHELGHALHIAGGSSLKSKWVALNTRTYGYTDTDYDICRELEQHFATWYAATNFNEDFAETFCALAVGQLVMWRPDKWRTVPEVVFTKAQLLKDYCVSTVGIPAAFLNGLEYIGDCDIPDWAVDAFAAYPKFAHIGLEDMRLPATRLDFAYALDDKLCKLPQYTKYDSLSSLETDVEGLGKLVPFLDIPIYRDPYFVNYGHDGDGLLIYSLMQAGIVNGTSDTTFSPDATVTRQEAAAMLYRALKHLGYSKPVSSDNFTDMADVADWAKEAVNAMSDTGIMNGVGGGRFDPNGLYTYNQVAVTVYRLYNYATANLGAGY